MSLAETLVAVAIIAFVIAISMPALGRTLERSREAKSMGNLRTIGQTIQLYVADNQGVFPPMCGTNAGGFSTPIWSTDILGSYAEVKDTTNGLTKDPQLAKNHGGLGDYAANSEILRCSYPGYSSSPVPLPAAALGGRTSKVIMVVAAEDGSRTLPNGIWYVNAFSVAYNPQGAYGRPSDRGRGRVLAVFADGHTEAIITTNLLSNARSYFLVNP